MILLKVISNGELHKNNRINGDTMEIKVKYRGKEQILKFEKDHITALDILKALGLSPEYAFVAINGELASEDQQIKPEDNIKVINAISGG